MSVCVIIPFHGTDYIKWRELFVEFGEIRTGDRVQVTLTERLAKGDRVATAADIEVY